MRTAVGCKGVQRPLEEGITVRRAKNARAPQLFGPTLRKAINAKVDGFKRAVTARNPLKMQSWPELA